MAESSEDAPPAIAVIGMAGRFPGAANVAELWSNLRDGVESISYFSEEEMLRAGVPRLWSTRLSRAATGKFAYWRPAIRFITASGSPWLGGCRSTR